MINPPSLQQLKYLIALAETRHFGRAAEACAVTQSTLSAGLQELESRLGARLVERRKRGAMLTPLGQQVVERARHILSEAEALVDLAQATREPLSGALKLGVIPTISPYLLPRIMPALRRRHPKLRLYLTEDLSARIAEKLDAGELDALLLALPYDLPGAETMALFDDAFLFACRKDHALAQAKTLPPERLNSEPLLLLQDGHCLRDHALAACSLMNRRGTQPFQATSLPTLIQMVDNGIGTTLLPSMAVAAGALKGTHIVTRPLAGAPTPSRGIGLAWRKASPRREEFRLLGRDIVELSEKAGLTDAA
ncbi:MAG: LysR substrate-binding domain-containing protein [Reyranellaceae bacterium]